jgi:hypothetical protein
VDRVTSRLFWLVIIILLAVGSCTALLLNGPGSAPQASGPPPNTSSAVGVIVGVDAKSLGDVRSFQLRTSDGTILVFGLSELQNGQQFAPGHLPEHQITADPVRVWYRDDAGSLQAIWLTDANP